MKIQKALIDNTTNWIEVFQTSYQLTFVTSKTINPQLEMKVYPRIAQLINFITHPRIIYKLRQYRLLQLKKKIIIIIITTIVINNSNNYNNNLLLIQTTLCLRNSRNWVNQIFHKKMGWMSSKSRIINSFRVVFNYNRSRT